MKDVFAEPHYPELCWDQVGLTREINEKELKAMICGGLPVEHQFLVYSENSSCRHLNIILNSATTGEAIKAAIKRGLDKFARFDFTVTTNATGTKATIRDPEWTGFAPVDSVSFLGKGLQRQSAHVLLVLASKLAFLNDIKVNACHFEDEAFFIPSGILEDPTLGTIMNMLKRTDIILDRQSIHNPLFFARTNTVYVLVAGNTRQLKSKTFIADTTLMTVDELVHATDLYTPEERVHNDTWRLIWQEIPAKARKGTLKEDK